MHIIVSECLSAIRANCTMSQYVDTIAELFAKYSSDQVKNMVVSNTFIFPQKKKNPAENFKELVVSTRYIFC